LGLIGRFGLFAEAVVLVITKARVGDAANDVQNADVSLGLFHEHFSDDGVAVVEQDSRGGPLRAGGAVPGAVNP